MQNTTNLGRLSDTQLEEIRIKLKNHQCSEDEIKILIHDMAYHQCNWMEIASAIGCSKKVIEEKYRDILNTAMCHYKHDMRRAQYVCAVHNKGNTTMLIWLGKQHLDQTEIPKMELKKDHFDLYVEWILEQKQQSLLPAKSK